MVLVTGELFLVILVCLDAAKAVGSDGLIISGPESNGGTSLSMKRK